ncbi:MAG: hypothetical protein L6R28_13220 [Planctomycetes bacterium]|nr:hypothetical protein [Planctomycetota bacterium]
MRVRLLGLLAVVAVLLASGALAGESEAKPPLAGLPSKPGPKIESITALGDNQWLDLGVPAADPTWGTACGRSWGSKALVFAPDLRGAFLFGEGRHSFVKADGHAMDDLWFYDINAHRWICLYPGTNPKTFTQQIKDKELKVDGLGRLVDKDGQPLPVHKLIHAWGSVAYDTDQKKFAFIGAAGPYISKYYLPGGTDMLPGLDLLKEQGLALEWADAAKKNWSPWYYDTTTAKWDLQPATGGIDLQGGPAFIYAPSIKKFLLLSRQGTATYDPAKRAWNVKPPTKLAIAWAPFCLDSKRNRVHLGQAIYDIASETWIDPKPAGEIPSIGDTNNSAMEYDAANDKVVVIQWAQPGNAKKQNGIYAYDPETNAWTGPAPIPPKTVVVPTNVCYDPELNVYLCYVAGDSEPNGHMWAYRYKKGAK